MASVKLAQRRCEFEAAFALERMLRHMNIIKLVNEWITQLTLLVINCGGSGGQACCMIPPNLLQKAVMHVPWHLLYAKFAIVMDHGYLSIRLAQWECGIFPITLPK